MSGRSVDAFSQFFQFLQQLNLFLAQQPLVDQPAVVFHPVEQYVLFGMMSRGVSPMYLHKGPDTPVFEVPVDIALPGMAVVWLLCRLSHSA